MEDIQKSILEALYNFFEKNKNQGTGDKEISSALDIDIDQVRVCFKTLERKGYIKLKNAASHSNPERILVGQITSEGRLAVKDNL